MANGWLKSSAMQDKIIGRVDGGREDRSTDWTPNKRAWTPERWAHRVASKVEEPKADLTKGISDLKAKWG